MSSQLEVQSEPAEVSAPSGSRLRMWPAVAILGLAAAVIGFFYFWAGDDTTMAATAIFMGSPLTALLLLLWWLVASGSAWSIRFAGLGVFAVWLGLMRVTSDPKMAMMIMVIIAPVCLAVSVLWLAATQNRSARGRLMGVALIAAAGLTFSNLFRFEGTAGDLSPSLPFRWSPTFEDHAAAYWEKQSPTPATTTDRLTLAQGDWPEFRGPQRDGVVHGVNLSRDWSEKPPVQKWKHPVGPGWSSFAVVGNFIFTQEQRREAEMVVCYRADNGKEVWKHAVATRFSEAMGGDGPRATPTFHDGHIFALGATGILTCLDALTGKEVWSKDILKDTGASNIQWGMAGSPLVVDEVVVVSPGGTDGQSLAAYDRKTGERKWAAGDDVATYSSPQLAVLDGVRQILIFNQGGLSSHDPETGSTLWKYPWPRSVTNNSTQPHVLDAHSVLLSSIFVGTIRLTIKKAEDGWSVEPEWNSKLMKLYYSDMVTKDGYAFGLVSGILTCIDLKTGNKVWKGGRYGSGQLLLVDDLILVMGEFGKITLVKATPAGHEEVAAFQALEGKTWNHPVIAHGKLFVRNSQEAACFEIKPAKPVASSTTP